MWYFAVFVVLNTHHFILMHLINDTNTVYDQDTMYLSTVAPWENILFSSPPVVISRPLHNNWRPPIIMWRTPINNFRPQIMIKGSPVYNRCPPYNNWWPPVVMWWPTDKSWRTVSETISPTSPGSHRNHRHTSEHHVVCKIVCAGFVHVYANVLSTENYFWQVSNSCLTLGNMAMNNAEDGPLRH